MSISDKNQPRLVLVVILLVFGSIMAYSLNAESKQKIDVEEGHREIEVKVPPNPEGIYLDNSTTAVTYIDNRNNTLELNVEIHSWKGGKEVEDAEIYMSVESNLESSFEPKTLKIKARVLNAPNINSNYLDFLRSYGETKNLKRWPSSKVRSGVAGEGYCFDGFDIEDKNFQARNIKIENEYHLSEEYGQIVSPLTIEIKAVMEGLSEDVEATVNVTFVQMGGLE